MFWVDYSSGNIFSKETVTDKNTFNNGLVFLHTHRTPIYPSCPDVLGVRMPISGIGVGIGAGNYQYFILRSKETELLEDEEILAIMEKIDEPGDCYYKEWIEYVKKYLETRLSTEEVHTAMNFTYDSFDELSSIFNGIDYDAPLANVYDKFLRLEAKEQGLMVYVGRTGDQIVCRHPLDQPLPRG